MPTASSATQQQVRIGPQGRLVIPADVRKRLKLHSGDSLSLRVEDDRIVLERPEAAIARIQRLFAEAAPGRSLTEELIAERREEARRESNP